MTYLGTILLIVAGVVLLFVCKPRNLRRIGPHGVVIRQDPGSWVGRIYRFEGFLAGLILVVVGLVFLFELLSSTLGLQ